MSVISALKTKYIWPVRIAVLVAAVILIFIGVINGDAKEVMQKAVNICLQCIGIG